MSPASRPTVLIIHEAWHTVTHYSRFIDSLTIQGFQVACSQLPTCADVIHNRSSFHDHVSMVYQLCFDLSCEGHDILVMMHGYGGLVGSEGLGELSKSGRSAQGQPGGIVGLIYVSSWLASPGDDLKSLYGAKWAEAITEQSEGTLVLNRPQGTLFNDMGPMEQDHWSGHLVPFSAEVADILISVAEPAWSRIPTTFLICGNDKLLSHAAQDSGLRAAQRWPSSNIIERSLVEASHNHFLNHNGGLLDVVRSMSSETLNFA